MTSFPGRARVIGAAAVVAASLVTIGCGGGTDIAPSDPVIEGQGFAAATIGGRDFGDSTQIDAGVSGFVNAPRTATDEPQAAIRSDNFLVLVHDRLSSPVVRLEGLPPSTTVYCQGANASCATNPTCGVPPAPCDYWVADATAGLIEINPAGALASGMQVQATYSYLERLLGFNIGLTFPSGQFVSLALYNVPSAASAPLQITTVSAGPPPSPFPLAFDAVAETNLTRAGGRERFIAADDPSNLVTLTDIDLTNEENPCLAGTATFRVRSEDDPTVTETLTLSFETPGC